MCRLRARPKIKRVSWFGAKSETKPAVKSDTIVSVSYAIVYKRKRVLEETMTPAAWLPRTLTTAHGE